LATAQVFRLNGKLYKEALINAILALSERGSRKVSFSTALQINGLTPLIWRHLPVSQKPLN